jgi:cobalt-zinc-cadmium efflux system outer membrane protein
VHRQHWRVYCGFLLAAKCLAQSAAPPHAITWQEAQDRFRANNPSLLAGQVAVDETRAEETTAFLRPNPNLILGWDQITPFHSNPNEPVAQSYLFWSVDYLHEREHKRELRLASARQSTGIAASEQSDLTRNLLFSLRDAFVRVLVAKAVEKIARENLNSYDKSLTINRDRYNAGAIAHVDLERLELQRVQFVSDLATSQVNLRTAKIDLQALLRDRTSVDDFDVDGKFDYTEPATTLEDLRSAALRNRPDLKVAAQSIDKARTDHRLAIANGASDPSFGFDVAHQPNPLNTYIGFSVNFPLRIFDKNQGEKARTSLDIGRTEKLRDAAEVAALHDVDAAYATLENTLTLLRPYKSEYLPQAENVRSTISFSYEHGAASLLDFLDAQKEYRSTQLSYANLVGAYLSAVNQLNFAVGQEVIP